MAAGIALVEQLLNGLTIGVIYVLVAAGLSIIFGVQDVINFAHGELFALGGYFAFALVAPLGGWGFWVALVVAPLIVGVIGAGIERVTLRPLYGRNPLYHILLTFGLVLIINDSIELVWGKIPRLFGVPDLLAGPVVLFGFRYPVYNYFIIVAGGLIAALTWVVLERTRFGLVARAGAQDRVVVEYLGIDIDRYYTLVFGFGAALAAVAGVVLGAYQNVNPGMGNSIIIPAFVIVVLGGMGSFRGAVVGGLGVGVLQTIMRIYVPVLEGLFVFLVMIAVLLVRPQGLFGEPEWQRTESGGERLLAGSAGLDPRVRRWLGIAAVALLLVAPLGVGTFYSSYAVTLLSDILIWGLFALSLDFVLGYAGLVSLGHAMFYGVGAYTVVLTIMGKAPILPPWLAGSAFVALALAIVTSALVSWIVGYLSIRVSGVYFAMITLAFSQLFYNAVFKLDWAGGSDGLFGVDPVYGFGSVGVELSDLEFTIGPVVVGETAIFFYLLVGAVVASYLLARRMIEAPFGSVLKSIRENETRSTAIGYDVRRYKRRSFVVSGALAGLAGALFALNNGYAAPAMFHWLRSGQVLVMAVLGGMGTLYGPMVGAGVFIGVEDLLSSYTEQWGLVLGSVFVLVVIFLPAGLVSLPGVVSARLDLPRRRGSEDEVEA